MRSLKNNVKYAVLALGLTLGAYGCAGLSTLNRYDVSDKVRLENMAKSNNVDTRREGLKGLCSIAYKGNLSEKERNDLTQFVYNEFDKEPLTFRSYLVGKIIYNNKLTSVGNNPKRTKIVSASWKRTKEVLGDSKERIIEACSKMGSGHVMTTTEEEAHKYKVRISQKEYSDLVDRVEITEGKTWNQILQHKGVEPAIGGYSLHMGYSK